MLAANEQDVQHCRCEAFPLQLAMDEQAVQHCPCEAFSIELCQLPLEFSWQPLKGNRLVSPEV